MITKSFNKFKFLIQNNKPIQTFSQWKHPTNLRPEKTIFPSPKEMFPKANPEAYSIPNDLTPSLFQNALGIKLTPEPRAAFMQFAKQNGQMYHIFDASKFPLGRICQKAAFFLQGKHRPTFRNCDQVTFDNIIIVNAENIVLTGKKALKKTIFYHSGYVGGIKERSYKHYLTQKPEQLIYYCISKMLPKNKKRRDLLQKIRIFRGLQHDHKEFPNFLPQTKPLVDEKLYNPFLQNIENLVIKYQSAQDTPKEFEGLKKDIDHNFEIPFNQRDKVVKLSAHNIKVFKAWKKYHAKLRRYKIHKIRPPLNRDPNNSRKSILITSEKYIKEHNLGKYIEPEEAPEEDDTIVKSFPKPTKIIY